jgi:hypothetical protein
MFYFGAYWQPGAFERFACSYNLVDWTEWNGDDLVAPSEEYDNVYAHKPWVIKWNLFSIKEKTQSTSGYSYLALSELRWVMLNIPDYTVT